LLFYVENLICLDFDLHTSDNNLGSSGLCGSLRLL
jgi:hypothetical protein